MQRLVQLPVGNGTPHLREPMQQGWITALSNLLYMLQDPLKREISPGLIAFAQQCVFAKLTGEQGIDLSATVSLTLEELCINLFHNTDTRISPSSHRVAASPAIHWSSILLQDSSGEMAVAFTSQAPYAQFFPAELASIIRHAPGTPGSSEPLRKRVVGADPETEFEFSAKEEQSRWRKNWQADRPFSSWPGDVIAAQPTWFLDAPARSFSPPSMRRQPPPPPPPTTSALDLIAKFM